MLHLTSGVIFAAHCTLKDLTEVAPLIRAFNFLGWQSWTTLCWSLAEHNCDLLNNIKLSKIVAK